MPSFTCPNCNWQTPDVSAEYSGRAVRCKQCQTNFRLPVFAPSQPAPSVGEDAFFNQVVAPTMGPQQPMTPYVPPQLPTCRFSEPIDPRPRGGVAMWYFAGLCSMLAPLVGIGGCQMAQSAIQETTVLTAAIALAVIPYCMARANSEIIDRGRKD